MTEDQMSALIYKMVEVRRDLEQVLPEAVAMPEIGVKGAKVVVRSIEACDNAFMQIIEVQKFLFPADQRKIVDLSKV